MEAQRKYELEQWHVDAAIRLSRIAMAMSASFTTGHDAIQTPEYVELNEQYLQLQVDMIEHDRFDPPVYKDYHQIG